MSQGQGTTPSDAFSNHQSTDYSYQQNPHPSFLSPTASLQHPFPDHHSLLEQPSAVWPTNSPIKRDTSTATPHFTPHQHTFDNVHLVPPTLSFSATSPSKTQQVYMVPPMTHGHDSHYPYPQPLAPMPYDTMFPFQVPGVPYPYTTNGLSHPNASTASINNIGSTNKKRKARDPLAERDDKKSCLQDPDDFPIPAPDDIAVPNDDGSKPPLSYAQLIGLSILKSQDRQLTLAQIYDWIRSAYSFYVNAEPGWMNSIRHNLSLNKAFTKKERPKDDPGKGHYWTIVAGKERQFIRDSGYRVSIPTVTVAPIAARSGHRDPPAIGQFKLPPKSSLKRTVDSSNFPSEVQQISSDGTVPASDNITPPRKDQDAMPPPKKKLRLEEPDLDSSPADTQAPVEFNSSPPIVPGPRHTRTHSSPTRLHSRQSSKSRPRSANVFRDSGFWSSIESSVPRATVGPAQLTSDNDRCERVSHILRGRAEDEIARLRSSSYDPSPSKGRPDVKKPSRPVSVTVDESSPLKPQDPFESNSASTARFGLQPPSLPPPAVSPTTNLRLHREKIDELVGTPARMWSAAKLHGQSTTPGFLIHEDESFEDAFADNALANSINRTVSAFELHSSIDHFDAFDCWAESPIKRSILASAKRPGMTRTATALGALEDITGRRDNIRLGSPIHMPPSQPKTPRTKNSPTKNPVTPLPPLDADSILSLPSDDGSAGTGKVDFFKGFRSIGPIAGKENCAASHDAPTKKNGPRPTLGRSLTQM